METETTVAPVAPVEKKIPSEKKYIFTIQADDEGMRVEFDALTPSGEIDEEDNSLNMTMIDISLVTVSLFKMLRDEGMTEDQLRDFSNNIINMSNEAKVVNKEEHYGKKDQEAISEGS